MLLGNDFQDHPLSDNGCLEHAFIDEPVVVADAFHRGVSFDKVQVRLYPMILGDNPAVQIGTPVTLDWDYDELPEMTVEDFESEREPQRRVKLTHFILNYFQRRQILSDGGYSQAEIDQGERQTHRDQLRRTLTKLFLPFSILEEYGQMVRKAFLRLLHCLR